MKTTANVKLVTAFLILSIMVAASAWAIPKPDPGDTLPPVDISKIIERVEVEWAEDGDWSSGWFYKGEDGGYMEMFFPKGQSKDSWKEMITIEMVAGGRRPNLPGAARMIFRGTEQSCPDATWEILHKDKSDPVHQAILFEIRCPKFIADQPPEVQIWKLIVGRTGMFIVQYTYRGEEMPAESQDAMKKFFDSTKIITENIKEEE